MTETNPIRVGVIGAGCIGTIHAVNLMTHVPGTTVTAIAAINVSTARELAAAGKYIFCEEPINYDLV